MACKSASSGSSRIRVFEGIVTKGAALAGEVNMDTEMVCRSRRFG